MFCLELYLYLLMVHVCTIFMTLSDFCLIFMVQSCTNVCQNSGKIQLKPVPKLSKNSLNVLAKFTTCNTVHPKKSGMRFEPRTCQYYLTPYSQLGNEKIQLKSVHPHLFYSNHCYLYAWQTDSGGSVQVYHALVAPERLRSLTVAPCRRGMPHKRRIRMEWPYLHRNAS